MAKLNANVHGRTKCVSSRKRSLLKLWNWYITVKFIISLPCIFSECLGYDFSVAVYPNNTMNVPYGDPLEILCIAENYTSNDIEFMLDDKILKSELVNETAKRLYIEKPEKQFHTYYCRNKKIRKNCLIRVLVDSPPDDITGFRCVSKNLDVLNCSWTSPQTFSKIDYSLTYLIYGNSVNPRVAEKIENSQTRYCLWNTSSSPRYRQQEETYNFVLNASNVFGYNVQNFTIDHFAIVKPDPPSDLKVIINGTHSVYLQWSIPNNIVDLLPCGVDHRIEYQIAKIDRTDYFRSVDVRGLPPNNKTYKFLLNNLPYAHMQYDVRIYIKSKKAIKEEFWSDFSYIVVYTASEKPKRPPDMTAGAFDQAVFNNKRVIYVYWMQLEEYEEAGDNFTYHVLVKQGSKTYPLKYPDKNKSMSYVILEDASLEAMEVYVWSENANGFSDNSSYLYIPPERDIQSLGLTSFTKLAYENGTYELSWIGINNIDNYTLFWCQHNATKICTGRLNFTVLDGKKVNHVIDLPREHRYQFAISANNGTKTSGMVWAKCDISKDGIAMYGFPVTFDFDAPRKTFVNLKWTMDCALQDGIIKGYYITYCPVIKTSSFCDTAIGNESVYISNPKQMEFNITKLLPSKTYQFSIALNTTYGLKRIENTTTRITTLEDTPTSPRNIQVTQITNTSFVVSWDPPLHRNGKIGKYIIYNYDKELQTYNILLEDDIYARTSVKISNLTPLTKYSISVQACNNAIGRCSELSPKAVLVTTKVGRPSKMRPPNVKNPDVIKWVPPDKPGGKVNFYQILRIKDDAASEILNTTNLSYSLLQCEGVVVAVTYQVRAVNEDSDNNSTSIYYGDWSDPTTVTCRDKHGLTTVLIFMALFSILGGIYGSVKYYKRKIRREDLKPEMPEGLRLPEKDLAKYTLGGWSPAGKDDKPSSDAMLLLPGAKTTVPLPEPKQNSVENCGASDHTDSTALSNSSRGVVDRQPSLSDNSSSSSLNIDADPVRDDDTNVIQDNSVNSDNISSRENSPYFGDKDFKKNLSSGYVQAVTKPSNGYMHPAAVPVPKNVVTQSPSCSTSYVMAGLSAPLSTNLPSMPAQTQPSTGYVRPEDMTRGNNIPKLGLSPTETFGSESLPTMPPLPVSAKQVDSSYIQLQSLDSLGSKPVVRSVPPAVKPSRGYVKPGDAVLNKHFNNLVQAGAGGEEEPALLDPAMSPDAYCRFSWSTDPANDNLHSLLVRSQTHPSKN